MRSRLHSLTAVAALGVALAGPPCWAQTAPKGGGPLADGAGKETLETVPAEDESFTFGPRARRDPFIPPYGMSGPAEKPSIGTRDTISRASKLLDDLTQAVKTKNGARFNATYENLTRLLDTRFTSDELKIYALEIGRRARQLRAEMTGYEQGMVAESILQNAENRLVEMQSQIQRGKLDQVKAIYQEVVRGLTGLKTEDPALKQRRDELLLRAGRLVSEADIAIARDLIGRGAAILAGMKDKLQREEFDEVSSEFQDLKNRIGALNLGDEELKKSRSRLLDEAAEVAHQAEIGAVKRELKKCDALCARMRASLDTGDFDSVNAGYRKVQEILKPVTVSDPALGEQKAEMLERAASLDRSANIRREFLGRKIVISGIAWSPTSPAAIVNGRTYGEGDALDEATRVEKIARSEIVFKYKGESVAVGASP